MKKIVVWGLGLVGIGIWTELMVRIVRYMEESGRKRRQKTIATTTEDEVGLNQLPPPDNTVILFPDKSYSCHTLVRGYQCLNRRCKFLHQSSFLSLVRVLRSAQTSLDLCIYVLTFDDLAQVLIDLHERNVKVRIIVDGREHEALGSKVSELRQRGLNIRLSPHSHSRIMHHKFAIIDGRTLVNGSFNWTKNAILNNYDNIMITSDSKLLRGYQHGYEKLWDTFGKATTDADAEKLLFSSG